MHKAGKDGWGAPLRQLCVDLAECAGTREEDVIFNQGKRGAAAFEVVMPDVVEVERCPVIDEPEASVPHQQVRVARGPVDVGHVRVEPHDRRGKLRVGLVCHRIKRHSAGQVVERQVEAGARPYQVLDFGGQARCGQV